MSILTTCLLFLLVLCRSLASAAPTVHSLTARIPIIKGNRGLNKRQISQTGAVGLGDMADNSYSIQVSISNTITALVFDTGSSDLWSISTDCTAASCGVTFNSTPQISASSLQSATLPVRFDYGDSSHQTFASGVIGEGNVSVASLTLDNQFLAACNETNSNVSDAGLSGIFGLGFPSPLSGSVIVSAFLDQNASSAAYTDAFISGLPTQGPFMSRLIVNDRLRDPMFTVTLQREDVEIGGNLGQLTIGALPDGVSNNSLTWVPVRLYTPAQGGLSGPTSNPNEVYPIRWEVPLDDVILNGQTLPKPQLQNGVSYTAVVDTGTSFLAGPQDIVTSVYSTLAVGNSSDSGAPPTISCISPVHLSFVIGGKTFPVDPRDFLSLQQNGSSCDASSLLPTDPPSSGSLMSWVLGDPFMKSSLVAFYLGNLTHPSVDPPRMGFLSTVPGNADVLLQADVKAAQSAGSFIATSVSAPLATFSATSTDANGVAQAPTRTPTGTLTGTLTGTPSHNNGAFLVQIPMHVVAIIIIVLGLSHYDMYGFLVTHN